LTGRPFGPLVYSVASRSASSVQNAVSVMPSGPKILVAKNSSSGCPDATSTTRPSTSVDTE